MRGKNRYTTSEWVRECPICHGNVYHKNANSLNVGIWRNCPCWECRAKIRSEKTKGQTRPSFSDEWKRNIGIGHKNSEIWKASMNTPEYKEKHRQKMLRMIQEGKTSVAFNPKACEVFNFFNSKLQWNGQHAKNGKEKVVDIFFLDYYEPSLNVAIEWDEKHHRKSKHRKLDGWKSKIVTNILGCEFYRIDDVSHHVRKIDHNSIDRTPELQQLTNEYYASQK